MIFFVRCKFLKRKLQDLFKKIDFGRILGSLDCLLNGFGPRHQDRYKRSDFPSRKILIFGSLGDRAFHIPTFLRANKSPLPPSVTLWAMSEAIGRSSRGRASGCFVFGSLGAGSLR